MARPAAWTHTFDKAVTQGQQALAIAFQEMIVGFAATAGQELGALNVETAGKFGLKLEERFTSDNPNPHRFYRASVGSTIERKVYEQLARFIRSSKALVSSGEWAGVYQGSMGTQTDLLDIYYAIEYPAACDPFFPNVFKKSRPDIRLSLGKGSDGEVYEALYDLTSEKQVGHIHAKGDNWTTKKKVAYVAEIVWADDDILHK
ncbi:MAG TPA: hypothetical protein VG939_10725 [Caulobacteraceae bacterium]|nr:hypothetical protein [Caulobacteraceae bacterium]